jgi:hypothetical protein
MMKTKKNPKRAPARQTEFLFVADLSGDAPKRVNCARKAPPSCYADKRPKWLRSIS